MEVLDKIKDAIDKGEMNHEQAYENVLYLYNVGCSFIESLIEKENTYNTKLMENLDLYKSKSLMIDYDKTFSQWNKSNLVLWDLKDILCRMGKDVD